MVPIPSFYALCDTYSVLFVQVTAEDIFANHGGILAQPGKRRNGRRVAASSSLLALGESTASRDSKAEDSMSSDDDSDDDDDQLLASAVTEASIYSKYKSSAPSRGSVLLGGVLAGGKLSAQQQQQRPQPTAKAVQALRKTLKRGLSGFAANSKPDAVTTAISGKPGKKAGGTSNNSNGRSMVSASALEGRFVAAGSLSSGGSLGNIKPINERAQRSAAASLRALDSDQV